MMLVLLPLMMWVGAQQWDDDEEIEMALPILPNIGRDDGGAVRQLVPPRTISTEKTTTTTTERKERKVIMPWSPAFGYAITTSPSKETEFVSREIRTRPKHKNTEDENGFGSITDPNEALLLETTRKLTDLSDDYRDGSETKSTIYGLVSTMKSAKKKWPDIDGDNAVIDIQTLVELIANLTLDYELVNITDLFNKTLLSYNIPKCLKGPTTTTTATTTTTTEPPSTMDLVNATIISKCFVCGMETEEIPRNAWCADAFSGDFIPIVKVDPMARGQLATFRKYCRYLDVPGVLHNESQPRSVYGRFTGGCSVRWIDLSGVYTQRACRNRRRPVMGKHFVSKRMAKLELALMKEDDGCIASPMASLVPLSRGISLYARFHACVCTGSWCNHAVTPPRLRRVSTAPLLTWILVMTLMIY